MTVYVVVDIGCIHCGGDTEVIGIYRDKARAESLATGDYFKRGERCVSVFPVEFPKDL